MIFQKSLDELRFVLHRLIDLVAMVLVICERRVYLCEGLLWVNIGGNLFRCQATQIAGRDDIPNPNAMSVDSGLTADNSRCANDVEIFGFR